MVTRSELLVEQDRVGAWLGCDVFATGSALFYGVGVDGDIVVLDSTKDVWETLEDAGWKLPADYTEYPDQDSSGFYTCRLEEFNLIVVHTPELFDKWAAATLAALQLQDAGCVLTKAQRAALFSSIVGSEDYVGRLDDRSEYAQ